MMWTIPFLLIALLLFPALSSARPVSPGTAPQPSSLPASQDSSVVPSAPDPGAVPLHGEPWMKPNATDGIDWGGVWRASGMFLAMQHGFRIATEPGTREGLRQPFLSGYANSLASLRGWSDGDPFLVNYVGHPMQGAVSGYIWVNHDRAFRYAEFGDGPVYWRSRLRAAAFSTVYSTQFEIGPLSEASIGQIQKYYPQHGFVDHVVTPVVGTGWMIAEDAIDRHIIRRIERHVKHPMALVLIRGSLNPARSFANAMSLRVPWARDTRPGVFSGHLHDFLDAESKHLIRKPVPPPRPREGEFGIALVEISMLYKPVVYGYNGGRVSCYGGGGEAALKVRRTTQMVLEVTGCNLEPHEPIWTGDTLTYLTGPRWTPRPYQRWSPYVQTLWGGMQATKESERQGTSKGSPARQLQRNSLAMSVGGGLDMRLHPAVSLRLARLEYKHVWGPGEGLLSYNNGLSFTFGLTMRAGTW